MQREEIAPRISLRQIVIPDGVGGHSARFFLDVRGYEFNLQKVKEYLKSGEHC